MKRPLITLLVAQILTCSGIAFAYEIPTHEKLSEEAVKASILTTDNTVLSDLGLSPPDDGQQKFPNSEGKQHTIVDLIQDGAKFEDNNIRALSHFYNPLTNEPLVHPVCLTQLCNRSPDWALEDQDPYLLQNDSFQDSRQFFLNALTLQDENERKKAWGRTFQGLGHIIHHIQDMAQPQHVRNDAHPKITDNGTFFFENPSLYEQITDEVRAILRYDGYEPVYGSADTTTFNNPRDFWHTDDGKGVADYTNRGFVSAGTNFDRPGLFSLFPSPPLGVGRDTDMTSECNRYNVPRPQGSNGQLLPCLMTFVETPVTDSYRSNLSSDNLRTSTYSIFNAEMTKYFNTKTYTLNRFNFETAHKFLIPRAVGYSAGLLNYFFRGKIDMRPDPDSPGNYRIHNLSDEDLEGSFTLYYDDQNGVRHPVIPDTQGQAVEWSTGGVLASGSTMSIPAFVPPTDPAPKLPGEYVLVFRGRLGLEGEVGSNTHFAVVGKIVNGATTAGLITTAGGDALGFAAPGDGGPVVVETGATLDMLPPATEALIVSAGETLTLGGGELSYTEITISGTLELTEDTTLYSHGRVILTGMITGQHANGDGIALTLRSRGPIVLPGRIEVPGAAGAELGSEPQAGGMGGAVTIQTASTASFTVPTIITRGGDAAFTDQRDPAKRFTGGAGGAITITANSAPETLALRFGGMEQPANATDSLPPQQGAHTLPSTTTFRRGLLTTGGYGGQFKGPDGELGVSVPGAAGGAGGNITITCTQPSTIHFEKTDLFTGGNIDVLLTYTRQVVFNSGATPRLTNLFQRTGAMGGQGSSGQTHASGGTGGSGGAAGAITITNCELATPPASFTTPPRVAPLILGGNPVTGLVTAPRPRSIDAFAASGARLYTIQAFGGAGGMPGGSGLSLARCAKTGDQCYTDGPACPLAPDRTTQICLPVSGGTGSPGNYGPQGADGPVSCGPLLIPPTLVGVGLVCQ